METTSSNRYKELEAQMLATPKHNSHKRSLLIAQMKEEMKRIKLENICIIK
jgi:hypothetical protein